MIYEYLEIGKNACDNQEKVIKLQQMQNIGEYNALRN